MRAIAADEATVEAGTTYLLWFMPALALQFLTQVLGAGLRATGIVRPTMLVTTLAVILNIVLAPVLITGWGTGHAFGVAGAGLASSIAVLIAVMMLFGYVHKFERYVRFDPSQWRPQFRQRKAQRRLAAPLVPLSNVKVIVIHAPEPAATPLPGRLSPSSVFRANTSWANDGQTRGWIEPVG